ncbi:MAG: hypothetical protein QXG80_00885 [Nanopusillaceae archaeon]
MVLQEGEYGKLRIYLSKKLSKLPHELYVSIDMLLYYLCKIAFLEYAKQLIEKNRDKIKLLFIASNDIEKFVIYEDKESFEKEFLNIVFSKYKQNAEFALSIIKQKVKVPISDENIIKIYAYDVIEDLKSSDNLILEEEGSNYKFNVYKFLFESEYISECFDDLEFALSTIIKDKIYGKLYKDFDELYRKFIVNSVELADVVVDVFKLCFCRSKSKYYVGNLILNIYFPINVYIGKQYRGKKYENFLAKLDIVLSMFFAGNEFFNIDLEYFKKEILYKKTKSNEKFVSEISAKVDSVIDKMFDNADYYKKI